MIDFPIRVRQASVVVILLAALSAVCCGKDTVETIMVPMSDGAKLATDVYRPEKGEGLYPVILIRTPYGKNVGKGLAANLGKLGFALVAQDMRGRFDSEGHHAIIFGNEGLGGKHQDGHDTIRWITQQSWCNGKIVSWGGSALGIVQNMTAPKAPEALCGQVVIMAFSDYYHQGAYQGGTWRKELLEGWLKATNMADVNLPTFLEHSTYDSFWKQLSPESHAGDVNAPGVYIGGWYDIFLQGTINSFTTIQKNGGPRARGKCFLVIGPVAHGNFNQKVDYPKASESPINAFAPMNICEFWINGKSDGVATLKPVHYYVMGDTEDPKAPGNVWRATDDWPPPSVSLPLYFHPDKTLQKTPPIGEGKMTFKYDPENPVPTIGGQNLLISKGPMDQREVESRADVLTFTTEALTEPLEVTGRVSAKLFVSSDCPDTDFTVKLCDVYPDGKSMLVTDGIQRASLRNSFERREPLEPGEVYELHVDLWSTSLIFNRGHRIRIAISSSNSPRFEPNANTGDPHPISRKTRVASNTIHLSAKQVSHVMFPVYREN